MTTHRPIDVEAVRLTLERINGLIALGEQYVTSLDPDHEAPFTALWASMRWEVEIAYQQLSPPQEPSPDV